MNKKYIYLSVDCEFDGPIPGDYSMVSFGAVVIDEQLDKHFYGELKPISDKFVPSALEACKMTREQTLLFPDPKKTMAEFDDWMCSLKDHPSNPNYRFMFLSDNNGKDFAFMDWYFHHFLNHNPFGHSSFNIGSYYKGLKGDMTANFKHLRKTKHSHNAYEDAYGNAEAFLEMNKGI